jgi:hypothetical protein
MCKTYKSWKESNQANDGSDSYIVELACYYAGIEKEGDLYIDIAYTCAETDKMYEGGFLNYTKTPYDEIIKILDPILQAADEISIVRYLNDGDTFKKLIDYIKSTYSGNKSVEEKGI